VPRAYWKGHLRLSLVTCPIELFPAGHLRDQSRRPIDSRHYQAELRTGQRISGPFGAVPEGLALPFACPRRRNLHFHSRA
jgi:hypothetical protein